jgi:hypothetical protein
VTPVASATPTNTLVRNVFLFVCLFVGWLVGWLVVVVVVVVMVGVDVVDVVALCSLSDLLWDCVFFFFIRIPPP